MRDEPVSETQTEVEIDPVCGMSVPEEQALERGLAVEYEGRQYRFCGPGCRERFLHRPNEYAVAGRTRP